MRVFFVLNDTIDCIYGILLAIENKLEGLPLHFATYIRPIVQAVMLFIPVAALFTLPFMIFQYRRYGTIPVLRVLVVYSFILYIMCAYLLTVLPLPSREKVAAMQPKPIQWIPFSTYADAFRLAGFRLSDPHTWLSGSCWMALLRSSNLFEIAANILMQIPLGIFMRYYFRRSRKQVLLIGIGISLFYELTQLSGLYGIYSQAYRLCSVDDLIDNTLGAMIGYWITPLLCICLPSREELDRISIERERRLTLTRRLTSAVIDWLPFPIVFSLLLASPIVSEKYFITFSLLCYLGWVALNFIVVQRLCHGHSMGKAILRIAVRDAETGKTPTVRQLLVRYFWVYIVAPAVLMGVLFLLVVFLSVVYAGADAYWTILMIAMVFLLVFLCIVLICILYRHREMPHSYRSHTRIVITRHVRKLRRSAKRSKNLPAKWNGNASKP